MTTPLRAVALVGTLTPSPVRCWTRRLVVTTKTLAGNAAHLARLLRADNYPPS